MFEGSCLSVLYNMKRSMIKECDLDTGVVVLESYRLNGKLHRDSKEGPAYIYRNNEDGRVAWERFYWNGRLHREDGPAKVEYNIDGTVMLDEMYYRHGLLHRDPKQGPAWIERSGDGSIMISAGYYLNGKPYRDPSEGPCYIARFDDGTIDQEVFSEPAETPALARSRRKQSGSTPAPS